MSHLLCLFHYVFIIIINPLTAKVVGAQQMILQPLFSIFLSKGNRATPLSYSKKQLQCCNETILHITVYRRLKEKATYTHT